MMCPAIVSDATVMSGDVGCWFAFDDILVGVFELRTSWLEFDMRSAIRMPRWSVVGECHSEWWALTSPVSIALSWFAMWLRAAVMF